MFKYDVVHLSIFAFVTCAFSVGEGNGNPLQYSCLESPGDRGAWWAAVYGVAQSWTRLKRLSSSSSKAGMVITSHYTEDKTEVQRGYITCLGHFHSLG